MRGCRVEQLIHGSWEGEAPRESHGTGNPLGDTVLRATLPGAGFAQDEAGLSRLMAVKISPGMSVLKARKPRVDTKKSTSGFASSMHPSTANAGASDTSLEFAKENLAVTFYQISGNPELLSRATRKSHVCFDRSF